MSAPSCAALTFVDPTVAYPDSHFMVAADHPSWVVYISPPITATAAAPPAAPPLNTNSSSNNSSANNNNAIRYRVHLIINPTDSRYRLVCSAKGLDDPRALFNLPQSSPLFQHAMRSVYRVATRVYAAGPSVGFIGQTYHVGKMSLEAKAGEAAEAAEAVEAKSGAAARAAARATAGATAEATAEATAGDVACGSICVGTQHEPYIPHVHVRRI